MKPRTELRDLEGAFRSRWGKAPSEVDLKDLLEKRPDAQLVEWIRALKGIRAEQDRAVLPAPRAVLEAVPASRRLCTLCHGRRGVAALAWLTEASEALRAGATPRDYRRTDSGEVQVAPALGAQLESYGSPMRRVVFLAWCDGCAPAREVTVSDCFSERGSLWGWVELAGLGDRGRGAPRQSELDLIERVLTWRRGEPLPGGYDHRLSSEEWLREVKAGPGLRAELKVALAGCLRLGDMSFIHAPVRRRGRRDV